MCVKSIFIDTQTKKKKHKNDKSTSSYVSGLFLKNIARFAAER
jgi:hypothetical protein